MDKNKFIHSIHGVSEIIGNQFKDERGLFINAYRSQNKVFNDVWGNRTIKQINFSLTKKIGTIRGMHLQVGKFAEAKLVRCLEGAVFDVVVDLRRESDTFGHWCGVELSEDKSNALLIPEGCAHGFQVIKENSKILYIHSNIWEPLSEKGVKFNDPQINIKWPIEKFFLSKKDLKLPELKNYEFQM